MRQNFGQSLQCAVDFASLRGPLVGSLTRARVCFAFLDAVALWYGCCVTITLDNDPFTLGVALLLHFLFAAPISYSVPRSHHPDITTELHL